jgi:hypothetical protein
MSFVTGHWVLQFIPAVIREKTTFYFPRILSASYLPALCPLLSALCPLLSALCSLPSAPCSPLSALCSLLSALCSLLSALCPLLSALCSLLSALCPLPSALCSLLSALCSLLPAPCSLPSALCSLQLLVFESFRSYVSQSFFAIFLVFGKRSFEEIHPGFTFKGENVGSNAVEEPAVV